MQTKEYYREWRRKNPDKCRSKEKNGVRKIFRKFNKGGD